MSSFNFPNGEPQTPTRTPTSPRFADTSFQTPKLESSFYDPRVTWNTADPYASSPEFLKTPQRFDTSHPASQWGRADRDLGAGASSEQISQQRSPNPGSAVTAIIRSGSGNKGKAAWTGEDDLIDSAKRNAGSMQTPPPTSTSRRKVQEYNVEGKRLPTNSPGPSHLDTPSRVAGVSPRLLWGLQGSPDLFQVPPTGPSTSPFFPQHRLFWDGDNEQQQDANVTASDPYADPFGANPRSTTDGTFTVGSPEKQTEMPQLPPMPGSLKHPDLSGSRLAPGSAMAEHTFTTPFSTSPRVTSADDPSMFLSSPARRFGPPEPRAEAALPPRRSRQPYHYQIEESKREEELRRAKSQGRNRASFSWDGEEFPAVHAGRPGIRRSSTHTGPNPLPNNRQPRQSSFSGPSAPSNGVRKTPTKGRISPLKGRLHPTQRSFSVAPIQVPTQPLVLKIDKDGRAKTEMKGAKSPTFGGMGMMDIDLDGSSTESDSNISDEYPAIAASRNTSFTFPEPSPSKPQYARSQSTSRPHSKSSSYSSTAASSHSGRHSPWAESSRGRPSSQIAPRHENRIAAPRSGSFYPARDHMRGPSGASSTALPDVDEDSGDAQQALKQVMNARGRLPRRQASGYPPSTRGSSRSSGQMRSSPPCRSQFDFHSDDATVSPMTATDSDFATPSTTRQSNPSNGTRCICNSMDNGGHLMIQW
ncbi:hypothetical protein FQN54_001315 [Arachnomyces sp. PD_36]|nr:hypothetical protein FQN54_001315 [Arachnomyces sp. PD_36]